MPLVEVALSYQVDSTKPDALRVHGKVEDFSPGTDAEVLAINDDETKGQSALEVLDRVRARSDRAASFAANRSILRSISSRSRASSIIARSRRWTPAAGSA